MPIDKKIIKITDEYFSSLEKFIKIMEEYFKLNQSSSSSSYIVSWLKQEIQLMNKNIEILFTKVSTLAELKNLMRHFNKIFNDFDIKGTSAKYIYDLHFINNIKISLESINSNCMKGEKDAVEFDLREYEIRYEGNKVIKLNCVSEIGKSVSNISQLISDFIVEFLNSKQKFIGIIFIEEYFFDNILIKEFLSFVKTKITKNMNSNYEVKPFFDNQESLATANQILINYGISILSIEGLFEFLYHEMMSNQIVSQNSIEAMNTIKYNLNEIKILYFNNLLKVKIETHFLKYFDQMKMLLSKDLSEEFKEPDRAFVTYFTLMKSLAKTVKLRTSEYNYVKFFILDNQFSNFLKIIDNIKILDRVYDTEFNLSKLGIFGLDSIVNGVLFVYLSITKVLGFEDEGKFKANVDGFVEGFIKEYGKLRNVNVERFLKNKEGYYNQVMRYINENKLDLLKGF
jgi:hypothetical protein